MLVTTVTQESYNWSGGNKGCGSCIFDCVICRHPQFLALCFIIYRCFRGFLMFVATCIGPNRIDCAPTHRYIACIAPENEALVGAIALAHRPAEMLEVESRSRDARGH